MVPFDMDVLNRLVAQRMAELRSRRPNGESRIPAVSQAELAEMLDIRRATIANIENERQRTPIWYVYALCEALGEDVPDVLPTVAEVRGLRDSTPLKTERLEVDGESREIEEGLLRELAQELDLEVTDAPEEREGR